MGSITKMVVVHELSEQNVRFLDRVVQNRHLSVTHGFVLGSPFWSLFEYLGSFIKVRIGDKTPLVPSPVVGSPHSIIPRIQVARELRAV